MTHIFVSRLTIIGSDYDLPPDRRQAIIWTNARILLTGPLGTNFSEILIEILIFSFKKMRLKVSSAKWRPFCLGLNVLTHAGPVVPYTEIDLGQHYLRSRFAAWSPIYWHGLALIAAWISNHTPSKVWDEIHYPFPNFNGRTVEVWEWIMNFIAHFNGCYYISIPRLKLIHVIKRVPDVTNPLPEPKLTYHQRSFVAFTRDQFHKKWPWTFFLNMCSTIKLL